MEQCPLCNSHDINQKNDYSFHAVTIKSPVFQCSNCNEIILSNDASLEMENIYRAYSGLLLPDEMKRLRKTISKTQDQIETDLSIGAKTYLRWENGLSIQTKANDCLLREYFDTENMLQKKHEAALDWINQLMSTPKSQTKQFSYATHSSKPLSIDKQDKIKEIINS